MPTISSYRRLEQPEIRTHFQDVHQERMPLTRKLQGGYRMRRAAVLLNIVVWAACAPGTVLASSGGRAMVANPDIDDTTGPHRRLHQGDTTGVDLNIYNLRLEITQDQSVANQLGMEVTSKMLQDGVYNTYFQIMGPMSGWLMPTGMAKDISCFAGTYVNSVTQGSLCDLKIGLPLGPKFVAEVLAANTRALFTNAGMLCKSNITWAFLTSTLPAMTWSCTPKPNVTTAVVTYHAPWLCCLFAPNVPSPPPAAEPPGHPPYAPIFPAWPRGSYTWTVPPPEPASLPPRAPMWPDTPPDGNMPGFPITDPDIFPPAPPPHRPPGSQSPSLSPDGSTLPPGSTATCGVSWLGYRCARVLGQVTLHWTWGMQLPANLCTRGASNTSTTDNTDASFSTLDFSPPSPQDPSLWVHYAVEGHAQAPGTSPPGYVALAFAQKAGTMAPALAVIGVAEATTGLSRVEYQLLSGHREGVSSTDLQAAVRQGGVVQQANMTLLCFSLPLGMATPPPPASPTTQPPQPPQPPSQPQSAPPQPQPGQARRQLLLTSQQAGWLPVSISTDTQYNWAVGPPSIPADIAWWSGQALPQHSGAGGVTFNLQSGAATAPAPQAWIGLLVTHACLLAAAFLIIFPAAGLVARHRHVFFKPSSPLLKPDPDAHQDQHQYEAREHSAGSMIETFPAGLSQTQFLGSPGRATNTDTIPAVTFEKIESQRVRAAPVPVAEAFESVRDSFQTNFFRNSQRNSAGAPGGWEPGERPSVVRSSHRTSRASPIDVKFKIQGPWDPMVKQDGAQAVDIGTTDVVADPHSPSLSRYNISKMARWLRVHVALNVLGFVVYVLALAVAFVWHGKQPDNASSRSVMAAHSTMGIMVLLMIIAHAATPLFNLHQPLVEQILRPNVHQMLGRLNILAAWVYGALTCVLIINAPLHNQQMALVCCVAPFAGMVLLLVSLDITLRVKYGSPRRATYAAKSLHPDPTHMETAGTFHGVVTLPAEDREHDHSSRGGAAPGAEGPRFVDRPEVPGVMGGSTNSSGTGGTGGTDARPNKVRRSVQDLVIDGEIIGHSSSQGRSSRASLAAAAAVGHADGEQSSRDSRGSSRPASASASRLMTPSDSIRRSPHLDSRVIQDAVDTTSGSERTSRPSPRYKLGSIVPVEDGGWVEVPVSASGRSSLTSSGRLDPLTLPPAVRQNLPPLALPAGRKPRALAPVTRALEEAQGAGGVATTISPSASPRASALMPRVGSGPLSASAASSPASSPTRKLARNASLGMPLGAAATVPAADEPSRSPRDRSSVPLAWQDGVEAIAGDWRVGADWRAGAERSSAPSGGVRSLGASGSGRKGRLPPTQAAPVPLQSPSSLADRRSGLSRNSSVNNNSIISGGQRPPSASEGTRPYRFPPMTDWGVTHELSEASDDE